MIVTQSEPNLVVPLTEGTIFEVVDDGTKDRQFIMNNTCTNTISYKFQYSSDRVTWTDLALVAAMAPGATVVTAVDRNEKYLRLRAYGNATMAVTVTRHLTKAASTVFTVVQA